MSDTPPNPQKTPPQSLTALFSAIGWALRAMQAEKAPYEDLARVLREAMQGLEGLTEEQFGQWVRVVEFLYALVQYRRAPQESPPLIEMLRGQTRQSKFSEREETGIMYSYADALKDEGRAEGKQFSLRAVLKQILAAKFGTLPETVTQAIASADLDTLNGWVVAAAVATNLAEVGIESAN